MYEEAYNSASHWLMLHCVAVCTMCCAEVVQEEGDATVNLHNQIALLKKQLASTGQVALEFVSLDTAKERMQQAVTKLMAGDESAEKVTRLTMHLYTTRSSYCTCSVPYLKVELCKVRCKYEPPRYMRCSCEL
jgi:hypothetical protein